MTSQTTSLRSSDLIDLAREADFSLGDVHVRPALSELQFSGQSLHLQPRVMQVLVALAGAQGEVVSRDELVSRCWGGLAVGEDAINRCIGRIRKVAEAEARGGFTVETLNKIGYRLIQRAEPASLARPSKSEPGRRSAPRLSIVVLPFANLSSDPDQDYLVDGVTESLTTDLSRISGSFVIARNTAFTFKGRAIDAKKVGEELNVRYVLEGSLQRSGSRLRVNVQLIDVTSGAHLWAERFDKLIADMFEMQDEIVTRLARALDVQLVAAEAREAERAIDPDSTDLYFQGQAVFNLGFGPEEWLRSRSLFQKALELDPRNVEALAALAQNDGLAVSLAFTADGDITSFRETEALAVRAVELAPNNAKAHLALARVFSFTDRVPQALAEYTRSLTLDPNYALAYGGFAAASMYGGKAEESEAYIQRAFRLSPQDGQGHLWCLIAGTARMFIGDDGAAEAWFRRGIEFNRSYPIQVLYLSAALAAQGKLSEARATAKEALALNPRFSTALVRSIRRSTNPVYMTQLDRVLSNLKAAGVP